MCHPCPLCPTLSVLALARQLAASADGLSLDEMADVVHASRRSIERQRDAVEAAFEPLDRIEDGRKIRFRPAARSLGNFAAAPTAEELTELENAVRALESAGNAARRTCARCGKRSAHPARGGPAQTFGRRRGAVARRGLRPRRTAPARRSWPAGRRRALLDGLRSRSTTASHRAGGRSPLTAFCSALAPISSAEAPIAPAPCCSASTRSMTREPSTSRAHRRRTSTCRLTPRGRSASSRRRRRRSRCGSPAKPRPRRAPSCSIPARLSPTRQPDGGLQATALSASWGHVTRPPRIRLDALAFRFAGRLLRLRWPRPASRPRRHLRRGGRRPAASCQSCVEFGSCAVQSAGPFSFVGIAGKATFCGIPGVFWGPPASARSLICCIGVMPDMRRWPR